VPTRLCATALSVGVRVPTCAPSTGNNSVMMGGEVFPEAHGPRSVHAGALGGTDRVGLTARQSRPL
jgi:hypothetical protein